MKKYIAGLLLLAAGPAWGMGTLLSTSGSSPNSILNQNTLQTGSSFYVALASATLVRAATITFPDGTSYTTAGSAALASGSTNYIQNTQSLQSGSTFYVSSGTTNGTMTANGGFVGGGASITSLTAANISAGSLGSTVIGSSITLTAMYGAPTLTGTNITSIPATSINAGSLGSTVIASSVTLSSINQSTVTVQGNTFNGVSQLVQMNSSTQLPAVSGVNLTNLNGSNVASGTVGTSFLPTGVSGIIYSTSTLQSGTTTTVFLSSATTVAATTYRTVNNLIAFSSVPVQHACGADLSGVLTSGTTFFTFVPDSAITLRRVSAAIAIAGVGGAGDSWTVGPTGASTIIATTTAAAAAGTTATTTGSIAVAAGTQVYGWLDGAATTKPLGNACVEYVMQ